MVGGSEDPLAEELHQTEEEQTYLQVCTLCVSLVSLSDKRASGHQPAGLNKDIFLKRAGGPDVS